jgi:hypothetical protein
VSGAVQRLAFVLVALSVVGCGAGRSLSKDGQTAGAGATATTGAAGATGTMGGAGATATTGAAGATGTMGGAGATATTGAAGGAGLLAPINAGCGKDLPASQVPTVPDKPTGYTHFTVMGTGATLAGPIPSKAGPRTFWVRVPADYDPNHRYRVVYIGQGCGGYEVANYSTMQLFRESQGGNEEAIYVALDIPRDMVNMDCYDNNSGPASQEWEAFELFHTFVDANYCVDNDNVFVSGYSTGGWLSNMWGCYFAGDGQNPWNGVPGGNAPGTTVAPRRFAPRYHVHGQAVNDGSEPANNPPCNGPVAAIWLHDLNSSNAYSGDHEVALSRVLRMNGCTNLNQNDQAQMVPWHEDIMGTGVCKQYTSCPKDYPVVFCTTVGQGYSDNHGLAIPGFTTFFGQAAAR